VEPLVHALEAEDGAIGLSGCGELILHGAILASNWLAAKQALVRPVDCA
jgi:hypothetical protein